MSASILSFVVAAVMTLLTGALTRLMRLKAAVNGHRQNHYTEVAVHRIAVIEGDGVGPEVVRESVKVLQAVTERDSRVRLQFDYYPWGTGYYLETGDMMPPDGLDLLAGSDAILFGAVGSPAVKDHITLRSLLFRIRAGFDQYVNLRPVRLLPGLTSPLRDAGPADIDMIFVREGTEGEYIGLGGRLYPGTEREVALQTAAFSLTGTRRVIRWAFDLARRERRTLTSVSKGNALQYSGVLWDEVFQEVAAEYPDVPTQELLVDAAAMFMVRDPGRFGVVVASNLYADILTDLGAGIMGGMGLAPSASLNPERRFPSTFEPIHGSAPDIAGTGQANPLGSIWSSAMMLGHLGFPEWDKAVRDAIELSIRTPETRTADLGGTATTSQVGDTVATLLREATAAMPAADTTVRSV
jgi:tartrate dehydrogenase/decarboxylase / D-malate dehydrogenase